MGEVNISDMLAQPFPTEAIKSRKIGGGMMASYVDTATVIRRLNHATGNNWSFSVDRYWIEGSMSFALVTITIPGMGSRQHIGVQSLSDRGGEDVNAKGAISDGLKKSATLFGIALELYGPDYEYGEAPTPQTRPAQRPRPVGGSVGVDKVVREPYDPFAAKRQASAGQETQVRPTSHARSHGAQPQPKDTAPAPPVGGRDEFIASISRWIAGTLEPETVGNVYNWVMGRPFGCRDAISGPQWREAAERAEWEIGPVRARFEKVVRGEEKSTEVYKALVTDGEVPDKVYWRLWQSTPGHGGMPKEQVGLEGEAVGE